MSQKPVSTALQEGSAAISQQLAFGGPVLEEWTVKDRIASLTEEV